MAGAFSTDNGNTTVVFSYTASTAQVQNTIEILAEELWDLGYGDRETTYDELTDQQKVDMVDSHILRNLKRNIKERFLANEQNMARISALQNLNQFI